MKINNNSFELNDKLSVVIDSSDNDGLIFIPNNIQLNVEIENYFGKITINKIEISPIESEFQISKTSIESHIPNLDIKSNFHSQKKQHIGEYWFGWVYSIHQYSGEDAITT